MIFLHQLPYIIYIWISAWMYFLWSHMVFICWCHLVTDGWRSKHCYECGYCSLGYSKVRRPWEAAYKPTRAARQASCWCPPEEHHSLHANPREAEIIEQAQVGGAFPCSSNIISSGVSEIKFRLRSSIVAQMRLWIITYISVSYHSHHHSFLVASSYSLMCRLWPLHSV
jgi:hypothetical protein